MEIKDYIERLESLDVVDVKVSTLTGCIEFHLADGTTEKTCEGAAWVAWDYLCLRGELNPAGPASVSFEELQRWKAENNKGWFIPPVLPTEE